MVQWLSRHTPSTGGPGSIHGQGTRSQPATNRSSSATTKDPLPPNKFLKKILYNFLLCNLAQNLGHFDIIVSITFNKYIPSDLINLFLGI